jgi:hypothetical protein
MADRQKIPEWDGSPEDFDEYDSKTFWFVKGSKPWEQEQAVSELIMNFKGKAWEAIKSIPETERSGMFGTRIALIKYLKRSLMESTIPEAGRHFREYLLKFRRQSKETMKMLGQRHRHDLLKLESTVRVITDGEKHLREKVCPAIQNQSHCPKPAPKETSTRVWRRSGSQAGSDVNMSQADEYEWDNWEGWDEDEWDAGFDAASVATAKVAHPNWKTRALSKGGGKGRAEEAEPVVIRPDENELIKSLIAIGEGVGARNPVFLKLRDQIHVGWRQGIMPEVLTGWVLLNKAGLSGQERAIALANPEC